MSQGVCGVKTSDVPRSFLLGWAVAIVAIAGVLGGLIFYVR